MTVEKEADVASEAKGTERPWWSDLMKDLTATGLATVFMTEDAVRNYLKEKKLPKELVSLVLEGLGKKRDDFYRLLAGEIGRVLAKVDVTKELSRFLESHRVKVELSFERKKNEDSD